MIRVSRDIKNQAEDIRNLLLKYNGIPSQTVDKNAYNKIKYHLKVHQEEPEIRQLIEEFGLDEKKKRQLSPSVFEERLLLIRSLLEKYQGLPNKNVKDYQTIYNFLWFNKEREIVRKLIFLYPNSISYSLIPIRDFRFSRTRKGVRLFHEYNAFQYLTFVYKEYGVLPCVNSEPMIMLKKSIETRGYEESIRHDPWLLDFVNEMKSLGLDENELKKMCDK